MFRSQITSDVNAFSLWERLSPSVCPILQQLKRGTAFVPSRKLQRDTPHCVTTFRESPKAAARCFLCQSQPRQTLASCHFTSRASSIMMSSEGSVAELQQKLVQLRVSAAKQNEDARSLRQQHASAAEIEAASIKLSKTRQEIVELEQKLLKLQGEHVPTFIKYRQQCENLLKRKFFVVPAFEIYGGVGGLYDFGPPGCALKSAVESLWRAHFVLEEDMLEVSGPCLTPHIVLKTSGHVDRFTDLMVKDEVTQECLRADKYLEEIIEGKVAEIKATHTKDGKLQLTSDAAEEVAELERIGRQADSYSSEELQGLFNRFNVVSPKGNPLSPPFPFNLMFGLKIGPKDESCVSQTSDKQQQQEGRGYLRPETAQGIFVNFRRLYEFVGGRMPFAAAQLGLGFRNEIAPRNGLLRVREFQMAEIEHFCHPEKKDEFPKFELVRNDKLPLFPRERQLGNGIVERNLTLQDAVDQKIIANRTLAYFLARTFAFLTKVGIPEDHIRFRQHLKTEMAHYAADCWDAEVETSYGWIEVAGHADRAAFDLTNHTQVSKVDLVAMEKFDPPRRFTFMKPVYNKQLLGSTFKQKQAVIVAAIEEMTDAERESLEAALESSGAHELRLCDGGSYSITRQMLRFEMAQKTVGERPFVPAVIEPSFGIGRILHCIMEHAFRSREMADQEERVYMRFPPVIAPTKVVLLPLSSNAVFEPVLQQVRSLCVQGGITARTDASSASIGKRYARNDELGTPFAITVDFESPKDGSVTLRERDSMQQVRLSMTEAVHMVKEICEGRMSWVDVTEKHQLLAAKEE